MRPWVLDLGDGRPAVGHGPFAFTHDLIGYPLLDRHALAEVAGRAPATQVEHHLGDLPLLLPTGAAKQLPVGPGQVLSELDHNGCWVALFNIDREAPYRKLVRETLDQVAPLPAREGDLRAGAASVFCAAAGAVVPVHFDRHHNLLLQVEGTKTVTIGAYDDPTTEQLMIERGFGKENADAVPPVTATFVLKPGDGVYIPPYAFHWVTNGDTASVSFSCSFHTTRSDRMEAAHTCNTKLRRFGLRPAAPGSSEVRDGLKAALLRIRRTLVTLRGR